MTEIQQQQLPLNSTPDGGITKYDRSSPSIFKTICSRLREHSGIWYMVTGNIIFSCCTFSLKLIPADMFDIMIVRFAIQSLVFGSYALFYKHYNVFNHNGQPVACVLNILMSSGTNLTYLAAFYFLPLSDLNTIKYTYIVWAAILCVIFLKDRFRLVNGISLALAVVGSLLATKSQFFIKLLNHIFNQPTEFIAMNTTATSNTTVTSSLAFSADTISNYYYIGIILAFVSSLTKAIQMVARKQLIKTKQPYSVMNFQFTIFALIISILYSIIRRFWHPAPYPWKWMGTVGIAIGCFQLITNTFYAKALKRENVQLLSIIGTLDILYACVLQYVFLRLTRSWMFYIGASLITIAAIILSIDSYQTGKEERQKRMNNTDQKNGV